MRARLFSLIAALCAAWAPLPQLHAGPVQDPPGAYRWRGMSLDVARHYFRPATIRRFIDLAAHYRLSAVHLHLTDNEAWRLPSRRYPLLPSPLHYSASQLRALAAYARANGIDLIPEIDLPAHAGAAIRSYPALACGAADTLCPNGAAQFAAGVVAETAVLFPSPYIHMGGDEVDGWSAQERRAFEQSVDTAIRHAHRTMIVWDDEEDAAPADAIVEVWHLGDAAQAAARRGHRIIIASDGPLYFDAVQGAASQEPPGTRYMSTLEEVYAFSPPSRAFGVEAVLWSEHVSDDSQLWYMLLPREVAFSAVALYGSRKPPWSAFRDRVLPVELQWLTHHAYAFRVPNTLISLGDSSARYTSVAGNPDAAVVHTRRRHAVVTLRSVLAAGRIRYRTASHGPWQLYRKPFSLAVADTVRVQAQTISPDGRTGAITTLFVSTSIPSDPSVHFDDVVSP